MGLANTRAEQNIRFITAMGATRVDPSSCHCAGLEQKIVMKIPLLWTALLLAASPAWAINKCTGVDGKATFQDAPCLGKGVVVDVNPAAGRSPVSAASESTPDSTKPVSEAQRIEAQVASSQRERRLREVQNIFYPQSQGLLDQHRRGCEQEQKSLAAGQFQYVQNLYGKTHAAQIAGEMAATSARCDLKDRELKEKSEALKGECIQLGGCKSLTHK